MGVAQRAWKKLRWSLAHRGAGGTARAFGAALRRRLPGGDTGSAQQRHPFDLLHGTDTSGLVGGGDLATGHEHDAFITAYWGMAPSRFRGALERWRQTLDRPAEDYTFVDIGCGKGRVVLMASASPFREVLGVELSPMLAEVARHNVELWRQAGKARCGIRVVEGDAVELQLPPGPCLVFIYNPFGAPVLRKLLVSLRDRVASGQGPLDVIYQNPDAEEEFRAFPEFRPLWREYLPLSDEDRTIDVMSTEKDATAAWRLE